MSRVSHENVMRHFANSAEVSGSMFFIGELPWQVRHYMVTRGLMTYEPDDRDWGYLTPRGEDLFREVIKQDPYIGEAVQSSPDSSGW